MANRLKGKTALITGASRGIGRGIAEAYAAEGANLVLNARDPARLDQTAAEMRAAHDVKITPYACDITDRDGIETLVAEVENDAPIDILVNNAGIHKAAAFTDFTFEDFSRVVETNVYGVFHVTQFVLRAMIPRRAGRIVNIASTAGKWGSRNQSAYNVSKHAVVGMTRCLGLEMAAHDIRVNAICPWIVETDLADTFMTEHSAVVGIPEAEFAEMIKNMAPIKRWVLPEEIAALAVFLGSDESSYVNGQSWTVDGGYTMI
jgi:NAD(P)-dependent dehydrogenase (short-subunit alcohol dehydrogenase family)